MSDHYNLLGVTPEASAEELRRAFRREAKRCHPDLHALRPPAEREALQRRFIELARAYQVLSSPQLRAAYDRQRVAPDRQSAAYDRQRAAHDQHSAAERRARRGGGEPGPVPRAARPSPGPAAAARAASPPPRSRTARSAPGDKHAAPDVGRIRRDAEQSLAAFGLDLRLPGEATLDSLLDWARGLYRDLAGAVRPGAATPHRRQSASAGARSEQRGSAGAGPRPQPDREASEAPHPSRHGRVASSARSAAGPADTSDPDIERELARLKREVRRGSRSATRNAGRAPTLDEELAELKRRHGRKPPA
jgi:curved DNA-binding protein CbpA